MKRKSKLDHVFETFMDTIRNSISVPYKWEFVSSLELGAMIVGEVVDLVDCTKQVPFQVRSILFGYEVAH